MLTTACAVTLLAACGGGSRDGAAAPAVIAQADPATAAVDDGRSQALACKLPTFSADPTVLAGNVSCANLSIGAVTVDNVEVPAGMACRLTSTSVRGSVRVAPCGILLAGAAVQVAGSVQGDNTSHVQVIGVNRRIGGNVFINGLTDVMSLKNTRVSGSMRLADNLGGAEITGKLQCTGNPPAPLVADNTAASIENQCVPGGGATPSPTLTGNVTCLNFTIGAIRLGSVIVPDGAAELRVAGTSPVGGSVQVQRGGSVSTSGMSVTGNMQVAGNRGGVTLSANAMGGVMQCKENLPASTGRASLATLKEDLCLGL